VITYAGVDLTLDTPEFAAWLNAKIPLRSHLLNSEALYPSGGPWSWMKAAGTPGPSLGTLYWPSTASRWAVGYFLAHQTQVAEIVAKTNPSGNRPQPQPLILGHNGGTQSSTSFPVSEPTKIDPDMYLLPPIPVAFTDEKADNLYLLTLVDSRYFWRWLDADLIFLEPTSLSTEEAEAVSDQAYRAVKDAGGTEEDAVAAGKEAIRDAEADRTTVDDSNVIFQQLTDCGPRLKTVTWSDLIGRIENVLGISDLVTPLSTEEAEAVSDQAYRKVKDAGGTEEEAVAAGQKAIEDAKIEEVYLEADPWTLWRPRDESKPRTVPEILDTIAWNLGSVFAVNFDGTASLQKLDEKADELYLDLIRSINTGSRTRASGADIGDETLFNIVHETNEPEKIKFLFEQRHARYGLPICCIDEENSQSMTHSVAKTIYDETFDDTGIPNTVARIEMAMWTLIGDDALDGTHSLADRNFTKREDLTKQLTKDIHNRLKRTGDISLNLIQNFENSGRIAMTEFHYSGASEQCYTRILTFPWNAYPESYNHQDPEIPERLYMTNFIRLKYGWTDPEEPAIGIILESIERALEEEDANLEIEIEIWTLMGLPDNGLPADTVVHVQWYQEPEICKWIAVGAECPPDDEEPEKFITDEEKELPGVVKDEKAQRWEMQPIMPMVGIGTRLDGTRFWANSGEPYPDGKPIMPGVDFPVWEKSIYAGLTSVDIDTISPSPGTTIQNFINQYGAVIQGYQNIASNLINTTIGNFSSDIQSMVQGYQSVISQKQNEMSALVNDAANRQASFIQGEFSRLNTDIQNAQSQITGLVTRESGSLGTSISNKFGELNTSIGNYQSQITSTVQTEEDKAAGLITTEIDRVKTFVTLETGEVFEVFVDIVEKQETIALDPSKTTDRIYLTESGKIFDSAGTLVSENQQYPTKAINGTFEIIEDENGNQYASYDYMTTAQFIDPVTLQKVQDPTRIFKEVERIIGSKNR